MSDTPETDTKQHFMYMDVVECVEIDFARKLERERDQARRELDIQLKSIHFHMERVPVKDHPLRADDAPLSGEEHEKSDTPQTDLWLKQQIVCNYEHEMVSAGFARTLERERNNLQDQRDLSICMAKERERERDEAIRALTNIAALLDHNVVRARKIAQEALRNLEAAK